jgi:hypothetical protein
VRGDGKSKFYRTLNLDKDSWDSLKFFNKIKKQMLRNEKRKNKSKENEM